MLSERLAIVGHKIGLDTPRQWDPSISKEVSIFGRPGTFIVNNAGLLEGGSVLDIPEANMRHQFEVNMIGPLLLIQGIAKQMVKRRKVRIAWVSSREGLNTNPFTGVYSASKHAVEAIAVLG